VPKFAILLLLAPLLLPAQKPENVLVVVNSASPLSLKIGEYYTKRRAIPLSNVFRLRVTTDEEIPRDVYNSGIAAKISAFLKSRHLEEKILYIVTTSGLPLRIQGSSGLTGDMASVDSELALLYLGLHGQSYRLEGPLHSPFFGKLNAPFRHPDFPMYLVTRLTGYEFADVRGIIDRSLEALNRGKFVLDLKSNDNAEGNNWLRGAASALPRDRVVLDASEKVLDDQSDVIGYAAWGSNDPNRKQRAVHFEWLPGAVMTEYVSTNGRTFARPPDTWTIGNWGDQKTWFAGSPQTMTADYVHSGATGASGHVSEPFLQFTPRPDFLFPAYYRGRNLAESYYLAIPALSWMNIVVGDPLCSLGKP
jgi:uncharacterized protein (TIGR03790 family)